jgi:hypothetical protein
MKPIGFYSETMVPGESQGKHGSHNYVGNYFISLFGVLWGMSLEW